MQTMLTHVLRHWHHGSGPRPRRARVAPWLPLLVLAFLAPAIRAEEMQTWLILDAGSMLDRLALLADARPGPSPSATVQAQEGVRPAKSLDRQVTDWEDRARRVLETMGVEFPPGAQLRFIRHNNGIAVVFRNTLPNLTKAKNVLNKLNAAGWAVNVEIAVLWLRIPQAVGARWGLDGGPGTAPKESPLKGPIPSLMTLADGEKLITGLRAQRGTQIIGSGKAVTLSGNTAIIRQVLEKRMIPDDPESRDLGFILECTPTLAADVYLIDLELKARLEALDRRPDRGAPAVTPEPPVAAITAETKVIVYDGSVLVLMAGVPAPTAVPAPASYDARPVLCLITTRLVKAVGFQHIVLDPP